MDYDERITQAKINEGEEAAEASLRPHRLEDYIGQKSATDNLKILMRVKTNN